MNELPKSVRDELARQQRSEEHPDANLLSAYSEGNATPAERANVEAHLAVCTDCRETLFLAAPPAPVAEMPRPAAAQQRSRWFPVWVPWAAAAAMIVGVGTLTYTSRHHEASKLARMSEQPSPTAPKAESSEPAQYAAPSESNSKRSPAETERNADSKSLRGDEAAVESSGGPSKPQQASAPSTPRHVYARGGPTNQAQNSQSTLNSQIAQSQVAPAPPPASNEAVEVQSNAGVTQTDVAQNAASGAPAKQEKKDAAALDTLTENRVSAAGSQATPTARASAELKSVPPQTPSRYGAQSTAVEVTAESTASLQKAKPAKEPSMRWRITRDGVVEQSVERGAWTRVEGLPDGVRFTVVQIVARDVWAGGSGDLLAVSHDRGATWQAVQLPGAGSGNIAKIEFRDQQHGTVRDSEGRSWVTSDRGSTWQQQPR